MKLMHRIVLTFLVVIICGVSAGILALTLHGRYGNPTDSELIQTSWKDGGPFELSPERGKYALTYSLLVNKSYSFSPYLAVFTEPDVAYNNGKYVSLFPPGMSYLTMPGYLIGQHFNLAQIGTFAEVIVFAVLNILFIHMLSRRLGAHPAASLIASLIFLFATPAFAYASTLYQHHVTTFLLLVSTLLLLGKTHWLKLLGIWFLVAAAIVIDTPNAFFFLPISIFAFLKIFELKTDTQGILLNIKIPYILTLAAILGPLLFLAQFNKNSYNNPYQLGGTVSGSKIVGLVTDQETHQVSVQTEEQKGASQEKKSLLGFFKTRNTLNGLYELFLSMDRGTIFFTPIILFGILGIGHGTRKNRYLSSILLSTIGVIVVLYSLWSDPYGGWAFGSRYLIPAYGLFAPYIAVALTRFRRVIALILLFIVFAVYSLAVNTMGALTTNANPPQGELLAMQKNYGAAPPVGYLNNYQKLMTGHSKSFLFNTYLHTYIRLSDYALMITGFLTIILILCLIWLVAPQRKGDYS